MSKWKEENCPTCNDKYDCPLRYKEEKNLEAKNSNAKKHDKNITN